MSRPPPPLGRVTGPVGSTDGDFEARIVNLLNESQPEGMYESDNSLAHFGFQFSFTRPQAPALGP